MWRPIKYMPGLAKPDGNPVVWIQEAPARPTCPEQPKAATNVERGSLPAEPPFFEVDAKASCLKVLPKPSCCDDLAGLKRDYPQLPPLLSEETALATAFARAWHQRTTNPHTGNLLGTVFISGPEDAAKTIAAWTEDVVQASFRFEAWNSQWEPPTPSAAELNAPRFVDNTLVFHELSYREHDGFLAVDGRRWFIESGAEAWTVDKQASLTKKHDTKAAAGVSASAFGGPVEGFVSLKAA